MDIFISWFPILLVLCIVWLVPISVILTSNKVGRKEKVAWIFASLFISWACLILFFLLAPLKPDDK